VHVIDHDDIEDSLTGNELILSSGVSLGHNAALQESIFPIMERRASAGLILSLGAYMPNVPDAMVSAANRHGIPLITMPWEVNFRDITQVLLTRIVRNQYQLLDERDSLEALLEGSTDAARIAALGPLPPGPYCTMVFEIEGGADAGDRRLIRRALEPVAPQARVAEYARQIVVLLPHSRRHTPRMAADLVLDRLAGALHIGLSQNFGSLGAMRDAYRQAGEAIALGRLLDPQARITHAEDVAALLPFFRAIGPDPASASPRIRALAEHDAAHGSDFVKTLEEFLNANQNAAVAARALGIHRHTLGYRLTRLAEILGIELTSHRALDLRLQLLAHRLTAQSARH